jgi:hypothetical protein
MYSRLGNAGPRREEMSLYFLCLNGGQDPEKVANEKVLP